jgi:hypothetical protein
MSRKRRKGKAAVRPDPEAEARLREVEDVLKELGVPLRYDSRLEGRGGLCRVHGEPRVILNGALPAAEKVEIILEAVEELGREGAAPFGGGPP